MHDYSPVIKPSGNPYTEGENFLESIWPKYIFFFSRRPEGKIFI